MVGLLTAAAVLPLGLCAAVIDVAAGKSYSDIVTALAGASSGDTVKLLGPSYTMTGALTIPAGVTLQGMGRDATVLTASGTKFRCANLSSDDSTICDLTITGFFDKFGAGVYMTKGTVKNCRIHGNHTTNGGAQGLGVYMTGGNVINCVISNCYTHAENGNLFGAGIFMTGGWVEGCLITDNSDNKYRTSFGGTVPVFRGGGVNISGGTLVNSTLSGNYAYGQAGGLYLDGKTARVINCIVVDNECEQRRDAIGLDFAPASATNYCSHTIIGGGAGEQYPGLGGWAGLDADFRPTVHSSGVGTGDASVSFKSSTDLDGNPRVVSGVTDLGCYAYTGDRAACGVAADRQFALVGATVTLTALVHSATAPASYSWSVTAPDSTVTALSGASPKLTLSKTGVYSLSLTAGGVTTTRADWLTSAPLTNELTAADSIASAVAVAPDGQVISLAEATYSITRPIVVRKDITILGQGYTNTIVRNTSTKTASDGFNLYRIFDIDSPGAVVDGLTARDGYAPDSRSNSESGIGIRVGFLGGLVRFCCVSNCLSVMSYAVGAGVALFSSKARLTSSIICDNGKSSSQILGGGVYIYAGEVDSCLICGNKTGIGYQGGGVYFPTANVGLLRNSTVVGNVCGTKAGGGIFFNNPSVTVPTAARVVNTILIGNTAGTASALGGSDWAMSTDSASVASNEFSYCFFDETLTAYGTGSRSGSISVIFMDPANRDYHLKGMT